MIRERIYLRHIVTMDTDHESEITGRTRMHWGVLGTEALTAEGLEA